jgi:hypothetical protein
MEGKRDISLMLNKEKVFYFLGSLLRIIANSQNMLEQEVFLLEDIDDTLSIVEILANMLTSIFEGKDEMKKEFVVYAKNTFGIELNFIEDKNINFSIPGGSEGEIFQ